MFNKLRLESELIINFEPVITPVSIRNILDATRIEEVIGDYVSLKRKGSNYTGLCPFHNERTPSFSVSASKGIYKCFGCGKSGNAINFLMEYYRKSFPEALHFLADMYHIQITDDHDHPVDENQQLPGHSGPVAAKRHHAHRAHRCDRRRRALARPVELLLRRRADGP